MIPSSPEDGPLERVIARLKGWFAAGDVTEAEVRAEIWRLGGRHRGEPLAGALEELRVEDLPAERRRLLHACVLKLRHA